jgi:hypothetical protein
MQTPAAYGLGGEPDRDRLIDRNRLEAADPWLSTPMQRGILDDYELIVHVVIASGAKQSRILANIMCQSY